MRLEINNFRSIRRQTLDLAPITVLYGPNGAGKSSLLYALLTLKNVVLNPNQSPDAFFNYVFANLGGFEAVVFDHRVTNDVRIGVTFDHNGSTVAYEVVIGSSKGRFRLSVGTQMGFDLPVSFPYALNQQAEQKLTWGELDYKATWNGVTAQVQLESQDQEPQASQLAACLNAPAERLRTISVVPLKRGFSKPQYSATPVSPLLITEDDIATSLSNDKYLVAKVSHYLEQTLGRDFRVHVTPGTAMFSLDATDKKTGVATELVNEGFGVNQTVHLLARCLHQDSEWVCIEEPEMHLHPGAIRSMASALVRIVNEEKKRFVISTHSEALVVAFLGLVKKGEINAPDVACYLTRKDGRETQFDRQEVKENGQIEGGLGSFIEAELADVREFMQIAK